MATRATRVGVRATRLRAASPLLVLADAAAAAAQTARVRAEEENSGDGEEGVHGAIKIHLRCQQEDGARTELRCLQRI